MRPRGADAAPVCDTLRSLLQDAAQCGDAPLDIAGLALALSTHARDGGDLSAARAHLDDVARRVGDQAAPAHAAARVAALRTVLVTQFRYHGDRETYDDLRNADLASVIERRRGLPVALAILWMHAARSQGWAACGLAFPGHFLIRIDAPDQRAILDPFEGGTILQTAELRALLKRFQGPQAELQNQHYAAVSDRAVLLRLQNNIKLRQTKANDIAGALATLERMLILSPGDAAAWHEAAHLNIHLDNLRAGMMCLRQAIALVDTRSVKTRLEMELHALAGRLN